MLWKWSVEHFEPLSSQEQQQFGGLSRLLSPTNAEGWTTRRELGNQGKEATYEMELAGKQISLSVDPGPQKNKMSIDLIQAGQASMRIWTTSQTPQKIRDTEYEHLFKMPQGLRRHPRRSRALPGVVAFRVAEGQEILHHNRCTLPGKTLALLSYCQPQTHSPIILVR
jgi:hypothetical protein